MKWIKSVTELNESAKTFEEYKELSEDEHKHMKWIKLFEDIDKDLYKEIDASDFCNSEAIAGSIGDDVSYTFKPISFSRQDTSILKEFGFKDIDGEEMCGYFSMPPKKYGRTWSKDGEIRVSIFKSIDDWYYVMCVKIVSTKYYKCDQMDGLLNCIKEECYVK